MKPHYYCQDTPFLVTGRDVGRCLEDSRDNNLLHYHAVLAWQWDAMQQYNALLTNHVTYLLYKSAQRTMFCLFSISEWKGIVV